MMAGTFRRFKSSSSVETHSAALQCSFTEAALIITLQLPTTHLPRSLPLFTPILGRSSPSPFFIPSLYSLSVFCRYSSMARSTATVLIMVAFLMVLASVREANAAIGCGQVVSSIAQCIKYIQKAGPLTSACCDGVKKLNSQAITTPDRQAACNCLKTFAGSVPNLDQGLAAGLPVKCGVNVPYPISTSTDCSRVH